MCQYNKAIVRLEPRCFSYSHRQKRRYENNYCCRNYDMMVLVLQGGSRLAVRVSQNTGSCDHRKVLYINLLNREMRR